MNIKKRIEKTQKLIVSLGIEALYLDDSIQLYYLTGLHLSAGCLVIWEYETLLLVDNRYSELARQQTVVTVGELTKNSLKDRLNQKKTSTLGFSSTHTTYKKFQELQELPLVLKPLEDPLRPLRMIKDPEEIKLLENAAILGSQGFDHVCQILHEGMTEAEAALQLELFWKTHGGKQAAFDPIIAFGANGSMPHYRAGKSTLTKGSAVLIDIGVTLDHYHSDMTRMVYYGQPSAQILEVHQIVQKAQEEALALCKPGTKLGALDKIAHDVIDHSPYPGTFTHSLGHGIGLEVHEFPFIRNSAPFDQVALEEGMVITIEPGIYLPGIGGVRIENTILITHSGYKDLTLRNPAPLILEKETSRHV